MTKNKKKLPKVSKFPKVDDMTMLMALLCMEDDDEEDDYKFVYPQWALDEENEAYGTNVIERVGFNLVREVYNYCREFGLSEEESVESTRNRLLFNKKVK